MHPRRTPPADAGPWGGHPDPWSRGAEERAGRGQRADKARASAGASAAGPRFPTDGPRGSERQSPRPPRPPCAFLSRLGGTAAPRGADRTTVASAVPAGPRGSAGHTALRAGSAPRSGARGAGRRPELRPDRRPQRVRAAPRARCPAPRAPRPAPRTRCPAPRAPQGRRVSSPPFAFPSKSYTLSEVI